ncbi:Rne/Rng family ribonuclease [Bradyrhizobium sp. 183]|uniref:Rne/Rng family ribonuclease n=1 Tax=Bradyrhizobium sp. CW4 TaxID=2782687 RepID=UPI00037FCDBD|nr:MULTISPECIES: ribonuclease E/G [unclassified Bradyrhizobium]MCK1323238.1 Rne/Rng family ribonuclease [Bradyrhizobium sp. 156]MCK1354530.1 Rne/Rng family ribonuclease [Bradyrhizobium sp. CW7]MCK1415780.1 Rne/Rng family ribonuclease [Bradyrhizobium sp. CW4]MCK1501343.1 Rne/Rng family ribonuclease [Bradyrhizobium sp. 188]MCK1566292.1 Rne/Rng family ribonuclease [Bradyrhizobium sp. 173]
MPNKMLIDATHPEETRVVVVRGNRVEEFDFETAQRKQLRGNIYLAKVTRVEPSLQAAFVEYGGNRHGFLAFSEIHPDYYQIPVADRQALIEAEEQAHREAEEESENRSQGRRRSRHRNSRRRSHGERVRSEVVEGDPAARQVQGEALPEGASHEGAHLHADAEHHGEHEGHDHHGHEAHDHEGHDHDDHHHAHGDDHHAHDHHDHDHHGEHDHHDHDHADETPAPVAAIGAEPAVATEAVAEPEEFASDAHAHDLAEAVTSATEPADAVYAAGESAQAPHHDSEATAEDDDEDEDDEEAEEDVVESVGGDDVLEEVPERTFRPRRQYKIQEVIKRRQVMLVQVVKEERGNKGAALTTYLSLAGRYAVLMPNTARGGGISRKITSAQDRSRLKEVVQDLDVPEGMGIILRTAGAARTKPEIKRDFEYLIRMWETVRDMTLKSQAPTLVYEEGSLIKRSLRDLYNKEIDEIQVAGDAGYREARDFMKMLMPANVSAVRQYRDGQPLFSRMGVESQLDAMFSPTVQLRSGGYIVINQTEALVSIDVNSGRSTREHHIEDTALKTNLEASEEVARQLRLRDLAGLIVIDFIDMDEKRNNRAVERKLSDCLRQDRARIQVGRISHFGLLEMSRQRIRASVLESSTDPCTHCGGTGHVRSVSSVALQLLRGLEEILMKGATHNLVVRTRTDVALYVLNHKRGHLRDLENGFKVTLSVIADPSVSGPQAYVIDRGEQVHTLEAAKALLAAQAAASPPPLVEEAYDDEEFDPETESEVETEETEGLAEEQTAGDAVTEQDGQRRKRRRRRRGRGGPRDEETREDGAPVIAETAMAAGEGEEDAEAEPDGEEGEEQAARGEQQGSADRRRRRGRRGGRRRRGPGEEGLAGSISDELAANAPSEATDAVADFDGFGSEAAPSIAQAEHTSEPQVNQPEPRAEAKIEAAAQPEPPPAAADEEHADDKAARRRSTVREKVSFLSSSQSEPTPIAQAAEPVAPPAPAPEPAPAAASETSPAPRRAGWWSRRFGGGE